MLRLQTMNMTGERARYHLRKHQEYIFGRTSDEDSFRNDLKLNKTWKFDDIGIILQCIASVPLMIRGFSEQPMVGCFEEEMALMNANCFTFYSTGAFQYRTLDRKIE